MIQTESIINIVDNSGAKFAKCIQISKKKKAFLGDIIIVSIQELDSKKGFGKIKKGEIFHCLLVRTKYRFLRKDGTFLKFNENAGILLNKQLNPIGSRFFGYSIRELRKKYIKIVSIFEKII